MQLTTGQQLESCDDRFDLVMQDDGNFVLYESGCVPLWSSGTGGTGCGTCVAVQNDGNFVAYGAGGVALWASNTGGH